MSSETMSENQNNTPLVAVRDIYKRFDVGGHFLQKEKPHVKALNGVTLDIQRGDSFCLVGESGCGKSTLARTIMGLIEPTGGEISYNGTRIDDKSGQDLQSYRRKMQMIFQNPYASLNPRRSIRQTLEEPLRHHHPDMSDTDIDTKVRKVMTSVGCDEAWLKRYPHEFSGGQRQRLSIARALMVDPEFLVADEPISALDVSIQAQVLNLMMDAREERDLTWLFITHDLSVVEHFGTRVGVMYLGSLVELSDTATLFANPQHPYTQVLLEAIPKLGGGEMGHTRLTGEMPSAMNLPSGCVFHNRCPLANDRCRAEVPLLHESKGAKIACHAVEEGRS